MTIFLDTSALYAILDADDRNHQPAKRTWVDLINQEADLASSNYALLETFALVQRRLGMEAARTLQEDVVPILRIEWVTEAHHRTAVMAFLTAASRNLSLVDCVGFEIMRRQGTVSYTHLRAHET